MAGRCWSCAAAATAFPIPAADADSYAVIDPDGSYAPQPTVSLALGHVDGNGSLDIVAAFDENSPTIGSRVVVLANDGHGAFTQQPSVPVFDPQRVALAPLGGSGDLDLIVTEGTAHTP